MSFNKGDMEDQYQHHPPTHQSSHTLTPQRISDSFVVPHLAEPHLCHVDVPQDDLRRKLAAAVRSVQWSYAIFWGSSTRQQGLLEWSDGDIKTRKSVQPVELNADEMGLQRSEQLRELYASLSAGDSNPQAKRPSASLSPEDLTDLEWYYLVCMSFTFSSGQGAFASGLRIWLCNANHADNKVFSRSLLEKSASIQGGILELGVTEQILEEATVIQCMKTTFLEFPKTLCCRENDHISNELDVENMNPLPKCDSQTEGKSFDITGIAKVQPHEAELIGYSNR